MEITTSLCVTQSRKYAKKWVIIPLFVALFCFAMTLCLLADRAFSWIHIALLVIGSAASVKCCFNFLKFMYPGRGWLARSLRPYLEESGETDVLALFRRIDKDMEAHGRQFDSVWVGREWVLGEGAMPIERIRGIFSFKTPTGTQPECNICLVDDRRQVQITSLASESYLNKVYSYLTKLLPRAACGNFRDYINFVGKTDEEMALFNARFLVDGTREKTDFVFRKNDEIPTSLISSDLIRTTVDRLSPEGQVTLTPCIPLKSPWGNSTRLCIRRIEEDKFLVIAHFKGREHNVYTSPSVSHEEAVKMLMDYFEKYEIPDPISWHEQPVSVEQNKPWEKYVLSIDQHVYKFITYDDVMASWDDLNEGKIRTILLHTPTCQSGYMQVSGSADNYTVEMAGLNSTGEICGYRTHTRYGGHVTHWLYEYYHAYTFPEVGDDWEEITKDLCTLVTRQGQKEG